MLRPSHARAAGRAGLARWRLAAARRDSAGVPRHTRKRFVVRCPAKELEGRLSGSQTTGV